MRILIVEDNPRISSFLQKGLREEGYVVDVAADGDTAFDRASQQGFDAAVVDVMIPGRSGFELVRDLRAANIPLPVLLLTARDRTEDKVAGLDSGADDYLTKPFEFSELTARLTLTSQVLNPEQEDEAEKVQFERIVGGLAKQLRSTLDRKLGRYSVDLPVFPPA